MTNVVRAVAASLLLLLATGEKASAQDARACVDAHAQAQQLRKRGRLRAARAQLLACAERQCPALARHDCATWLEEVSAAQPTLIVSATDAAGHETGDVRVVVDGETIAEHLDGRPLDVDPGAHVFQFEFAGRAPVERQVFVNEGEKNRVLRLDFPGGESTSVRPSPPAPSAPPRSTTLAPALVAGGVTLAATAVFAIFAVDGKTKESHLSSTCAPHCTSAQRDAVLDEYRVADVALGIAVAAAAATVLFVLLAPKRSAAPMRAVLNGAILSF